MFSFVAHLAWHDRKSQAGKQERLHRSPRAGARFGPGEFEKSLLSLQDETSDPGILTQNVMQLVRSSNPLYSKRAV